MADWLDKMLERIGLTRRERNDMVTFWCPMFEQNAWNLAEILVNDARYEKYTELSVEPAPESMLRVFLIFKGVASPTEVSGKEELFGTQERKGGSLWLSGEDVTWENIK